MENLPLFLSTLSLLLALIIVALIWITTQLPQTLAGGILAGFMLLFICIPTSLLGLLLNLLFDLLIRNQK